MLEAATAAQARLDSTSTLEFAEVFVSLRMEFFRTHGNGLITSTVHGVDYFTNVITTINGGEWEEKGVYGENFRRMIRERKKA